jgi:hypothetical protein
LTRSPGVAGEGGYLGYEVYAFAPARAFRGLPISRSTWTAPHVLAPGISLAPSLKTPAPSMSGGQAAAIARSPSAILSSGVDIHRSTNSAELGRALEQFDDRHHRACNGGEADDERSDAA